MARNTLKLDTSGFERLLAQLQDAGGDAQLAATQALEKAGRKISGDTLDAINDANLPAGGKYSTGETRESVVTNARVTWSGSVAEIPVGFDFSKPGAGGFLITGTPKMKPDKALNRMYKQKRYMRDIQDDMYHTVMSHVIDKMEDKR